MKVLRLLLSDYNVKVSEFIMVNNQLLANKLYD